MPDAENALRELRSDLDVYIRGLTWLTSHYPGLSEFQRSEASLLATNLRTTR